jgi:PTS system galactitol-specific IIA component
MSAASVFDPAFVRIDVVAPDATTLLGVMADELHAAGIVKESFKDALLAREEKFPTGLPTQVMQVAIPHTDVEHVERSFISVARLAEPVAFHEMGANARTVDVGLVCMLAVADKSSQVGTLQALIGMFSDQTVMERLRDAPNDRALFDVVVEQVGTVAA